MDVLKKATRLHSIALVALTMVMPLIAARPPLPVPGAGVVERELEREYEANPLERNEPVAPIQIEIPRERLEIPDGKKIKINQIRFRGNESISDRKIYSWIEGCLESELSLQQIYDLCQIIDCGYAKEGYFLARAYPPAQTIENGVLVIEVIEGKLGYITIEGNCFYSTKFICSYFKHLIGKPLCYDEFVKALMLLNDNTDLLAGAVFEKGQEFGYADVILRINDDRPLHLYLNGNNYGRNLTTNARAGGRLDWGNFFFQGDTLSVAQVVGFPVNALYFSDAIYTVPLNSKGAYLEGAYLYSKFKIEELKSLRLKGISEIATLKFIQAMIRRQSLSADFFAYFDYKQIQNFVLGTRTAFDKLRVVTVGTSFDHFGQNLNRDFLVLRAAAGVPRFLGGLKAVDKDCSRVGAGGRFYIGYLDYDHIHELPRDWFFYFHATGQYSPNKLALPEQIYIGGADTVRGFPLAEAVGDSGYYFNFEFRFPPPFLANKNFFNSNKKWKEVLQFDGFFDQGGAFLHSDGNTYLTGSGVGVRVNGPWTLAFSIDVGFPLNHRKSNRGVFTYIKLTCQPF